MIMLAALAIAGLLALGVIVYHFRLATFPDWTARDWRKLLAMFLLSGGGMAITITAWRVIGLVADRSVNDPWPLAYALYSALALLGLVLISLGWALGKTNASGTLPGGASFNVSGGDGGDEPLKSGDTVQMEKIQ